MIMYNLYEFTAGNKLFIQFFSLPAVCAICISLCLILHHLFLVLWSVSVFLSSHTLLYIIIATDILLIVACVECFRTTSITMYMFLQCMLYYSLTNGRKL